MYLKCWCVPFDHFIKVIVYLKADVNDWSESKSSITN